MMHMGDDFSRMQNPEGELPSLALQEKYELMLNEYEPSDDPTVLKQIHAIEERLYGKQKNCKV